MPSQAQTTYLDSSVYENGQLERKGLYYQTGNRSRQWGIWEYWYEDGEKELELWSDTIKTKYINMWLPNGEQILKSGNGFYYSIEPGGDFLDSLVYEIKDSIKRGVVKRFRSYANDPYFLVETGFYKNEKESGVWHFRDTVLKTTLLRTYENGKQNGVEISFYLNGKIKDSLNYFNGQENGNYKEYSKKGYLIKDCNYKGGKLIDTYKEYFLNGRLKIKGQYTQGAGYIVVNRVTVGRSSTHKVTPTNRFTKNKPMKQGVWKYFNNQGQLIRTETYVDDKILNKYVQ